MTSHPISEIVIDGEPLNIATATREELWMAAEILNHALVRRDEDCALKQRRIDDLEAQLQEHRS